MPETRVRFSAALKAQWGHVAAVKFVATVVPTWPRLKNIKIKGGFHDDIDVDFGPGLTAVIGGKGTGKSTLIEILRYVLHAGEPAVPGRSSLRSAGV
jgi:ABC-type transport system involved in cytochrome bd biosynthesis fused ATPase/permease subunit